MTFAELVSAISQDIKIPKTKVSLVLRAFSRQTRAAALSGEKVTLIGFGHFYRVKQQPRELFGGRRRQGNHLIRFKEVRHGKSRR